MLDSSKYVVLDVETNGLSPATDDLLSISIYQPDTQNIYNKFLPLELNDKVFTTHINGITEKTLEGATALTQKDVDKLFDDFGLKERIILTYGNFDEKCLNYYFGRKGLKGYKELRFFNIKRKILSSKYSNGAITKDSLCKVFKIPNVTKTHTGINDCILEWKLFEILYDRHIIITNDSVFEYNNDYILPVSYLTTYPNFKYLLQEYPQYTCNASEVKKITICNKKYKRFPTNFNGVVLEHLINSLLNVEVVDSKDFLFENKKKLKFIGHIRTNRTDIYLDFKSDGTVSSTDDSIDLERDKRIAKRLNNFILALKPEILPLIEYIKKDIFGEETVRSQELVVNTDRNILALCDLSSDTAVLEIKSYCPQKLNYIANQLYYESNGRNCYLLCTDWLVQGGIPTISFTIYKIQFQEIVQKSDKKSIVLPLEDRIANFKNKLSNKNVDVVLYTTSTNPITLKCKICDFVWSKSYNSLIRRSDCPNCSGNNSLRAQSNQQTILPNGARNNSKKQISTSLYLKKHNR